MKKRGIIFGVWVMGLCLVSAGTSLAQTIDIRQSSTSSTDWGTAANWSTGVPTTGSAVTINGLTVNIASGTAAAASSVLADFGAKLNILNGGTLAGGSVTEILDGAIITVQAGGALNSTLIDLGSATDILINRGTITTSELFIGGGTSKAYLMGDTSGVAFLDVEAGGTAYIGIDSNGVATGTAQTLGDIIGAGSIVIGKVTGGAATTLTLNVTGSDFTGVISGGGNLAIAGSGDLTLEGVNTYTGTTAINAATMSLSGVGSIASSQSVTINTGGSLDISAVTAGNAVVQNLSGDATGLVVLGANTLSLQESANTAFLGVISGTGGLEVAGSGVLTLSGINTYTGATTVDSGATVTLAGTGSAIATSSSVILNGTLNISTSQTIQNLAGTGTAAIGGQTLTVNETGTSTFSGTIGGASGNLVVGGTLPGTLILTGTNTYTGTTTLSGTSATLQIGNGGTTGTLGTGAVSVAAGNTLAFNHSAATTQTVGNAISGAGILAQEGGTTVLTNADSGFTGVTNVRGGVLEVDGTAFGSSTVNVSGGTLRGTGAITHGVAVTTGTLAAGTASSMGTLTMGSLTLAPGSTVVLRENAGTHDAISVGSSTALAGTLEFVLSGAPTTLAANNALNGITLTAGTVSGSFNNVVVAGTGTLVLGGTNDSFTGALLVSQGTTLSLTTALAVQHATSVTVNGGLLMSADQTLGGLGGSGTVALGDHTLTVNATGSTEFSGVISGGSSATTGDLAVSGGGRLILSGNNSYTGTTTLSGNSTLQIGDGGSAGTLGAGGVSIASGSTLAFDHADGTSTTVANALSGAGALSQLGGITVLTGNNSGFTGATTVAGGVLEVDSALASGVTVNGGTLRGNNTITGDVHVAGGTLGAGTTGASGTLTIAGNLVMQSTSAASFRVTGPSSSDQVVVNGNATIAGKATFYVSGMTVRDGEVMNVIKVTGTESGNFSSITNGLGNALKYQSVWNPGAQYVQIVAHQGSFMPYTTGGNQAAAAANLDGVIHDSRSNAVIDYLNATPGSQLGAAMSRISPTPMTAFPAVLSASSDNVSQSLSQRMGALRAGSTGLAIENLDLGPNTVFDPRSLLADNSDTAPIGYDPVPLRFLAPVSTNRWGTFISGLGTSGSIDDSDVPGYDYYAGGFQAGVDYRLCPNLVVGVAAGYQHGQTDFNQSSSQVQVDTGSLHLYSTWNDTVGDWVGGSLGGSYDWFDSKRESLGGTASAKPKGAEIDGTIEGGHDFKSNTWTITPTLGLLYSTVMLDSFTESGSLTPLTVDSHNSDSLRSRLGMTIADSVPIGASLILHPYVEGGWQHEYLDESNSVSARFASGAGGVFNAAGPRLGSDSATFGFGVSTLLTPAVTAGIGYFGQANSDYLENNIQGNVRYQF